MTSGPLPLPPTPPRLRSARTGVGVSGGASLGVSVTVHAALLAGAVWLGVGRPAGAGGAGRQEAEPPRLLAILPAQERPEDREPEFEAPEELPPSPQPEPEPAEALPEIALEPELLVPEPPELAAPDAPAEPLPAPTELLARVRPRQAAPPAAAPQGRVAADVLAVPTPAPAASRAPASPAPAPGRALAPRSTPTPTWPSAVPFEPGRRVGILFYVRADGSLAEVRVESSSGSAALDEHVRAFVARTWSFQPTDAPRWARQSFRPAALAPSR